MQVGIILKRNVTRKAVTVCLMSINVICFQLHELIFVLVVKENLEEDVALESVLSI